MTKVKSIQEKKAEKLSYDAFHTELLKCCDVIQRGELSKHDKAWVLAMFREGYQRFDDVQVRQMIAFTIRILEAYY